MKWSLIWYIEENENFPKILQNISKKSILRNLLESSYHWAGIVCEKLNQISFVTWAVTITQNFEILLYLRPVEKLNICIFAFQFFSQTELKMRIVPQSWDTSTNFEKKIKLTKKRRSESIKNQRCSVLFLRKSVISNSESTPLKDFQVMKRAESELKIFWIRTDQRWLSPRRPRRLPEN